MNKQNLQTLKGFRDFLPTEKRKRDFVMAKIIEFFERFGFEPLETPTLEYASLLLGKYGTEADKLVYKFLDRGEREVALRYDQTVPTARILAQYQNELPKYFRRYQIQNVFRADKPQKGRFREFTQCDIDIFGSNSPIADAEIIACAYFAYRNVGFDNIVIKINDRQVLFDTLTLFVTDQVTLFSIVQSIDKLDKQSEEQVKNELVAKGLTEPNAFKVLTAIKAAQVSASLDQILACTKALGVPDGSLVFNPTTARGLDYYTGMIFEVVIPGYSGGSVGGGGRYDNLIKQLSDIDIPAVGIGMGFDRMVEAADELGVFNNLNYAKKIMVTVFSEQQLKYALSITKKLRAEKFIAETCLAVGDLGKQLKIASQKRMDFVIIAGENEQKEGTVTVKNLKTGEQQNGKLEDLIILFK
ncbi:histidine--tRNA ligase [Candidatus Beckwithbacteria bacterium CG23_combo_of_CG06-09_8_20_14_all_34_8]|uniref:Histidine--tRNA ligase n=1 Tax=Candidatus Beckwithbacteria bacterium CG23_combo_of_CG06-09_8_20_14_all_34_8 TaxID=1974497 RepID=A0A2H0B5S1_9BACT|nr:MAG: histidine--tRNA ligase [Candidatus Beckwithbacteria bacterium CG23_combo_of_CG06-09_8_20_14_all_34_8]